MKARARLTALQIAYVAVSAATVTAGKLALSALPNVEVVTLLLASYGYVFGPGGVLSASRDARAETVVNLLPAQWQRRGLFPAGRLDKDTEGLLILTDDGDLAHRMLAPKSHVSKLYEAELDKPATAQDAAAFAAGLQAGELTCLPAELLLPEAGGTTVRVRVCEGKFHQVKRMFHAVGKEVLRLRRLSVGGLRLDPALAPGEARLLTPEEIALIFDSAFRLQI